MSTTAPQLLSRKTNGATSGSQPAGSTKGKENQKNSSSRGGRDRSGNGNGQAKSGRRQPASGEKVIVRRLPPGMTEAEFMTILGEEWSVGKGLVDWFYYAAGKVSSDAAKPSIPARAYLHLIKKESTMPLNDVVRTATWEDAKATFTNPSLIAPPALEFAIYKKVPSSKKRADARQGTIDQDPEFMAFLEGLANPVAPAELEDGVDAGKLDSKVTTTPLVEYLKEKKASKGRDSGKGSKHSRQESSAAKGKGAVKDDDSSRKKGREPKGEKASKAPKENVKILTKKNAAEQSADASKKPEPAAAAAAPNGTDAPKSRRAGIAAAARLLQRDLGLSPGSAHRRARQDAAKADTDTKSPTAAAPKEAVTATAKESVETTTAPTDNSVKSPAATSGQKAQGGRRNRGGRNADKGKATEPSFNAATTAATPTPPVILKKKPEHEPAPADPPKETASEQPAPASGKTPAKASTNKNGGSKKPASISPGVTRGFVKHANSSQGITEPVLREALAAFGSVTSLELDKRKGFAYVDFAEHEGLVKAAAASPITVSQGAVLVLERKDKKPVTTAGAATTGNAASEKSSGGRNRRGRGGGGGKNTAANSAANGGAKEAGQAAPSNATASGG
ncbi:smg-4/UPF3 family protein [Sarocladium implicatum]|nr:smg-4/UPF3 family protein [Sarocladium implicatum]